MRPIPSTSPAPSSAHFAQRDWERALRLIDAILEVKRALKRPAEDVARDQGNRANVLGRLGRFGEAKSELEACLQIFENSPTDSAKVLGSLADLFHEQGDVGQAIIQERRALALRDQLPVPSDRALSHGKLANCLEGSGTPSDLAESPRHRLAALVYRLAAGLGQDLKTSLRNYAVAFHSARSAGVPLSVPRVVELLADPAFHPLAEWLRKRGDDIADVQAAVDQTLAMAQQAAEETE